MSQSLLTAIQALAQPTKTPKSPPEMVLDIEAVSQLAEKFKLSPLKIERLALENNIVPLRYARNLNTYSLTDQIRLLDASVSVVGLGGLGGTVIEILARAGVGSLNLVDGDLFEEHNLNRQLLSTCDRLGTPKSTAAVNRIHRINPSLSVHAVFQFLNPKNAVDIINGTDVVVDCLDNIHTRFILAEAAEKLGRPMVSAAVGGLCGHVTTLFPRDRGLESIYGEQNASAATGGETALGCLPQAVITIAAIQCSEVFKLLLKRGDLLRRRLLIMDLNDNTFETMKLE